MKQKAIPARAGGPPRRFGRHTVAGVLIIAMSATLPAAAHELPVRTIAGTLVGVGRSIGACGLIPDSYKLTILATVGEDAVAGAATFSRLEPFSSEADAVTVVVESVLVEGEDAGARSVHIQGTGPGGGALVDPIGSTCASRWTDEFHVETTWLISVEERGIFGGNGLPLYYLSVCTPLIDGDGCASGLAQGPFQFVE